MKLTNHFQLSEFTRSGTASRYGINNSLNPDNPQHAEIIANIKALCENVLEPLRSYMNESSPFKGDKRGSVPLIISSGYRCPQLNNHPEVRGVPTSQHMKGEAADLRIPNLTEARKWMEWIANELAFDQLILEHCKNKDGSISHWIHVSYSHKRNRQKVISNMWKK